MRIQEVINGKEITIIGTAHISSDSVEEVKQALIEIQPDTVAIELDDERYKLGKLTHINKGVIYCRASS